MAQEDLYRRDKAQGKVFQEAGHNVSGPSFSMNIVGMVSPLFQRDT